MKMSVSNGSYLLLGMQLEPRKFVPRWFGDFVIWLFFHRLDTETEIEISGLSR